MKRCGWYFLAATFLGLTAAGGQAALSPYSPVFNPVPHLDISVPELRVAWGKPLAVLKPAPVQSGDRSTSTSNPDTTHFATQAVVNDRSVEVVRPTRS